MPPKKRCACSTHDDVADTSSSILDINKSKKYKKDVISHMQRTGNLKPWSKCLCLQCYEHASESFSLANERKFSFHDFCSYIESNTMSEDQFAALSKSYGILLRCRLLSKDPTIIFNDLIENKDNTSLVESFDKGAKEFLFALANSTCKETKVVSAYEQLNALVRYNYIGKVSFAKTLISYFISGSRQIIEMNAQFSPSGSYTTVLDYLKSNCMQEVNVPMETDCVYFFDNNQILARSWNVKFNSKPLIGVITTIVSLHPPLLSRIQYDESLMPYKWMVPLRDLAMSHYEDLLNYNFRKIRAEHLTGKIQTVASLGIEPSSSRQVAPPKPQKVSFNDTDVVFEKHDTIVDPYDDVPSNVAGKTEITLLPTLMVNPCSFSSLETVLDDIISKDTSSWVAIGCDGLPYNLCSKLIDNQFICPTCNVVFKKRSDFIAHTAIHPTSDIEACKKYGNVLLLAGYGHIEINIVKCLFKLLWHVLLKDVALMLGWTSPKALVACEKCTDHHKACQIINIVCKACENVILSLYGDFCKLNGTIPSVNGLYLFANTQHPNFVFLFKVQFTYLLAFRKFRSAMRRGNFPVMLCSLHKLSALFYGTNMTTYMDIMCRYMHMYHSAPAAIQEFMATTATLSQSGHKSKAEGGDFILESVNKKIKSWMPSGVPTPERWMRVCSNIHHLDGLKHMLTDCGDEDSPYFRKIHDTEAVNHLQRKLRDYLTIPVGNEHTSLSGVRMDHELITFDEKCEINRQRYVTQYPNVKQLCERVFITEEDRHQHNDIRNKTKAQIKAMTFSVLNSMVENGGKDEHDAMVRQWETDIKTGTKDIFIHFYGVVCDIMEEVLQRKERETQNEADSGPAS